MSDRPSPESNGPAGRAGAPRRPHPSVEGLSSRRLLSGSIFDVVEESVRLPSGLQQDLLVVEHAGAVCIAAVDAAGRLLLVRQYRHPAGDWLVEIPAGRLEAGEEPLAAARRELEEETGHRAASWNGPRSFLPAPGFCSEVLHLFFARELEAAPGGGEGPDPDEEIEVLRMRPEELLAAAPPHDGKTLVAALLLLGGHAPAR